MLTRPSVSHLYQLLLTWSRLGRGTPTPTLSAARVPIRAHHDSVSPSLTQKLEGKTSLPFLAGTSVGTEKNTPRTESTLNHII